MSKRLALPGIAYAIVVAGVLLLGSSAIPIVLGAEYAQSVGAIQMLAALPLLRWIHYLAADSLTGAGHHGARTVCQIGVAMINVGLNLWLITAYSWAGAVMSSLICDGLLAVLLWGVVVAIVRGERVYEAGRGRNTSW